MSVSLVERIAPPMSNRPRAKETLRAFAPKPEPRTSSGEHVIHRDAAFPPPRPSPNRSGEYRATRIEASLEDAQLSAVERELPRPLPRLCDTVRLEGPDGGGVIHLVEGEVAWVVTHGFGLPSLRRRLEDDGLIQAHEIDLVIALCRSERLNFVEMLVELELVAADDLMAALRDHVEVHMRALLGMEELRGSWERGTLTFTGDMTVALDEILTGDEIERWGLVVAHAGGVLTDRRQEERVPVHGIASVESPRGHVLMMTENVSTGGALLRTPSIIDVGQRLVVRLSFGDDKLELRGRVVRFRPCGARHPQAIAVAWEDMESGTRQALERILAAV